MIETEVQIEEILNEEILSEEIYPEDFSDEVLLAVLPEEENLTSVETVAPEENLDEGIGNELVAIPSSELTEADISDADKFGKVYSESGFKFEVNQKNGQVDLKDSNGKLRGEFAKGDDASSFYSTVASAFVDGRGVWTSFDHESNTIYVSVALRESDGSVSWHIYSREIELEEEEKENENEEKKIENAQSVSVDGQSEAAESTTPLSVESENKGERHFSRFDFLFKDTVVDLDVDMGKQVEETAQSTPEEQQPEENRPVENQKVHQDAFRLVLEAVARSQVEVIENFQENSSEIIVDILEPVLADTLEVSAETQDSPVQSSSMLMATPKFEIAPNAPKLEATPKLETVFEPATIPEVRLEPEVQSESVDRSTVESPIIVPAVEKVATVVESPVSETLPVIEQPKEIPEVSFQAEQSPSLESEFYAFLRNQQETQKQTFESAHIISRESEELFSQVVVETLPEILPEQIQIPEQVQTIEDLDLPISDYVEPALIQTEPLLVIKEEPINSATQETITEFPKFSIAHESTPDLAEVDSAPLAAPETVATSETISAPEILNAPEIPLTFEAINFKVFQETGIAIAAAEKIEPAQNEVRRENSDDTQPDNKIDYGASTEIRPAQTATLEAESISKEVAEEVAFAGEKRKPAVQISDAQNQKGKPQSDSQKTLAVAA